jgi:hypothetical protein
MSISTQFISGYFMARGGRFLGVVLQHLLACENYGQWWKFPEDIRAEGVIWAIIPLVLASLIRE